MHGAKEPRVINLIKQTHFGEPLTTKDLKSFCRERQVDWEVAHQSLLDFNICTILHPHQTCVTHFLTLTWEGFKRALPLYAPLHIVTTLVVLLAKLTSQVKERVKRAGSFLSLSRSLSTEDFVEAEEMLMMQEAEPQSPRSPRSRTDLIAHQVRSLTAGVLRMFTKQRLVWTATYTLSILRRLIFNIIRSSLFLGFYCSGQSAFSSISQCISLALLFLLSLYVPPSSLQAPGWQPALHTTCPTCADRFGSGSTSLLPACLV